MKLAMEFINKEEIFHLLTPHYAEYLKLVNSLPVLRTEMEEAWIYCIGHHEEKIKLN